MTAYNVIDRTRLVSGQPEDISVVLANLDAIAAVLNGDIRNDNVNAAAAIALSKLAGYPADATKFARGDGTWAAPIGSTFLGARVYSSINQSIPNTTETALTFNQEEFDTDTIHDTVVNPSRMTAKTAGKYLINAKADFVANSTGYRYGFLRINGVTGRSQTLVPSLGAADSTSVCVTGVYDLALNDYVEFCVWQNSGGALDSTAGSRRSPSVEMIRVG